MKRWIKKEMDYFVQNTMQNKLDEIQKQDKEVPQSFSPVRDLYVNYRIINMIWRDNTSLMFEAMAAVLTTVDGKNQTYQPGNASVDFLISERMLAWQKHTPKDNKRHLLQGLSISTEFLSRLVSMT